MRILISVITVLLLLLTVSTCYYDSQEYLFPQLNNTCDTSQYTFALSVKPILQNNCYSCHSNSTASFGGNVKLENYADVKTAADNGSLLGTLEQTGNYPAMPQGASKLDACKITIIRKWIQSGAMNN
jgi:uncharacterized membrane protein